MQANEVRTSKYVTCGFLRLPHTPPVVVRRIRPSRPKAHAVMRHTNLQCGREACPSVALYSARLCEIQRRTASQSETAQHFRATLRMVVSILWSLSIRPFRELAPRVNARLVKRLISGTRKPGRGRKLAGLRLNRLFGRRSRRCSRSPSCKQSVFADHPSNALHNMDIWIRGGSEHHWCWLVRATRIHSLPPPDFPLIQATSGSSLLCQSLYREGSGYAGCEDWSGVAARLTSILYSGCAEKFSRSGPRSINCRGFSPNSVIIW